MRRFHIDNRDEIGDTLTLRSLIARLQKKRTDCQISVRTDPHGLLADLGVTVVPVCCPVCLGAAAIPRANTPYLICQTCGLWFQPTPPKHRYEAPDKVDHGREMMTPHAKEINEQLCALLIEKYKPKSVLDVGSKYPWLLKCMEDLGVKTQAIDGCKLADVYGKELAVPMIQGNFLFHDFKGAKFDMVTMVHVLEHFSDPRQALRAIKRVLRIGGNVFIRVPTSEGDIEHDTDSNLCTVHPIIFNTSSLKQLLDEEGFETITIWPMPSVPSVDFELKYVEDRQGNAILHQWTNKTRHGDFIRRKYHFYKCPEMLAQELGWIKAVKQANSSAPLVLPALPKTLAAGIKLPKKFVVIAHESGGAARQWPLNRWVQVAEWLAEHAEVVVLGKQPLNAAGVVDLSGKTTVLEAAKVIAKASLVLSTDTAAAHIAAAARVPAIALMGPANEGKTFPTTKSAGKVKVVRAKSGCRRCYHTLPKGGGRYTEGQQLPIHHSCDYRHPKCMDGITVTQVMAATAKALGLKKPRARKQKEPMLSVCMMVKNEERSICDALESVHAAADEIVILDTGCTDKTIELAKRFPKVKVFSHPIDQIDDFAAMRNLSFSHATGRYVMWFDAGDRISDAATLRKEVRKEASDVISLKTVYGTSVFWRERVVPRRFARFQHRVHETMVVDGLSNRRVGSVVVKHVWFDKVGRESSLARNVRLLKLMLDEHPADEPFRARWEYYLARELRDLGKLDEALEHYKTRVSLSGYSEERTKAALELADVLRRQGNYMEGIKAAYEAMKLCDTWRDPYYIIGDCYFLLGEYSIAVRWFEHARQIQRPDTNLAQWDDIYTWLCECQLSYCHERLGNKKEALRWAKAERRSAPSAQTKRISLRIKALSS